MKDTDVREAVIEGLSFVVGVFIYALCFNMLLNPNNLVVSGFSGISILTQRLFGWEPSVFIYATNFILLLFSLALLGWTITKKNIVGSILYPLMMFLTKPIAAAINSLAITDDFYIILVFTIVVYGVSSGLIYRSGFTTGGSDIIMQIISKYLHVAESKAMVFANIIVIICGMTVFGFTKGVYSFVILTVSTIFVDKVMFGTLTSKVFYIQTKKYRKIKSLIVKDFESGFTIIPSKGGYTSKDGFLIMCVIDNNDYYSFKRRVLELDPKAFIIIENCYEVNNGVKKRRGLPFI